MTILEFISNNKNYLEDLITRSTYHSNAIEGITLTYAETSKNDRIKYFEFLRNNDVTRFAEWLKDLSTREEERMTKFGYKK